MDFSERYRIVSARDRRFDGQFIMAVRTTGIYCRPSCPARTPKPGNVEFFPTSAAAHLAGYRACKRCLPEAVPGSPAWSVRGTTAGRAMRLIADGVVEREGVGGLAARLGYSERQLGRILVDELGAGPLALARAQRAHNARQILVSTDLAIAETAFAAGFSSVRQFNDTVSAVFGMTPGELRLRAGRGPSARASSGAAPGGPGAPASVRVVLAHRAPLDARGLFRWFAPRAIAGVEVAESSRYARALRLPGGPATLAIMGRDERLEAELRVTELADLPALIARARRLFDLDADPEAVDAALGRDPRLAPAVAAVPGVRLPGLVDVHEMIVRAILGQQVTVASARGQVQRLSDELGEALPEGFARHRASGGTGGPAGADPEPSRLFPTPGLIAQRADEIVRGPAARRRTLRAVCEALASGDLDLDVSTPREEFDAALQRFVGIGPWTAGYAALRFLGAPDVFLPGDVAARKGARLAGLGEGSRLLADVSAFAPWRSYLMMHLWRIAG